MALTWSLVSFLPVLSSMLVTESICSFLSYSQSNLEEEPCPKPLRCSHYSWLRTESRLLPINPVGSSPSFPCSLFSHPIPGLHWPSQAPPALFPESVPGSCTLPHLSGASLPGAFRGDSSWCGPSTALFHCTPSVSTRPNFCCCSAAAMSVSLSPILPP